MEALIEILQFLQCVAWWSEKSWVCVQLCFRDLTALLWMFAICSGFILPGSLQHYIVLPVYCIHVKKSKWINGQTYHIGFQSGIIRDKKFNNELQEHFMPRIQCWMENLCLIWLYFCNILFFLNFWFSFQPYMKRIPLILLINFNSA